MQKVEEGPAADLVRVTLYSEGVVPLTVGVPGSVQSSGAGGSLLGEGRRISQREGWRGGGM